MGAVGGLLGMAGGMGGTGFSAPSGTSGEQINHVYDQYQNAMTGQQDLLSALKAQNGLQNQSNVYNQMQGVASGQGPNPAQAMLNQSTGQNVANQAALMAGQRGAGQNVGMMARQAGQQGGALQQQAAGQGASMQAQQSLNALGQAGQMAGNMANNQIGQTNAVQNAAQNEQGILQGANQANNNIQGQMANTYLSGQQATIGGMMNSGATAAKMMADGGEVGGSAFSPQSMFAQSLSGQAQQGTPSFSASSGTNALSNGFDSVNSAMSSKQSSKNAGPDKGQGAVNWATAAGGMANGGKVKAMVSPEEIILTPEEAKMVADGRARASQVGEKVPGKAPVKGNSFKNDTVQKNLPEGGIVVPNSKTQAKNPDRKSADFVRDVMRKKSKKS